MSNLSTLSLMATHSPNRFVDQHFNLKNTESDSLWICLISIHFSVHFLCSFSSSKNKRFPPRIGLRDNVMPKNRWITGRDIALKIGDLRESLSFRWSFCNHFASLFVAQPVALSNWSKNETLRFLSILSIGGANGYFIWFIPSALSSHFFVAEYLNDIWSKWVRVWGGSRNLVDFSENLEVWVTFCVIFKFLVSFNENRKSLKIAGFIGNSLKILRISTVSQDVTE